ncbi:hypothetical protein FisN_16Lh259 [Fistulifera solaris]|uniref:Magnesium-dependent phosphatase 1 n=1 Tax=Fistulifera solaris TaxID=1519565 RepID=A0A1Z5J6D6_FISSO|nr:hypothetical protein FisN_16Lh259 [Fistulifera solaris]|eukprot:GAX09564.1 hypothetical protein FisN_16Lh259 [Fistulifera solaris]
MRLAVFDLDYTIWQPEMYQLHGRPKLVPTPANLSSNLIKETRTKHDEMILVDSKRTSTLMRVFPGAASALYEIKELRKRGHDIQAAVSSRTDEPEWARMCMDHLVLDDGVTTLAECFGRRVEIGYNDKSLHLQRLHQATGVSYHEMCFFDNEHYNIKDVQRKLPAVKCFYTPNGMSEKAWEEAKSAFRWE